MVHIVKSFQCSILILALSFVFMLVLRVNNSPPLLLTLAVYNLQVYQCLLSTTRKVLGPSTILQAALPDILEKVPQSYFDNTMNVVEVSNY